MAMRRCNNLILRRPPAIIILCGGSILQRRSNNNFRLFSNITFLRRRGRSPFIVPTFRFHSNRLALAYFAKQHRCGYGEYNFSSDSYNNVPVSNEERWEIRFNELKEYKREHGDTLVPNRYAKKPQLRNWVNKQRTKYKSNHLSDERIHRPIGNEIERGVTSIEGSVVGVDYGSSFLQRLTVNGEQESLPSPSPLQLTFDGEQDDDDGDEDDDDTFMHSAVSKSSRKRPIEVTQGSDDEGHQESDDVADEEEDEADEDESHEDESDNDDCTEGNPNKRAKYSEETTLAQLIDNSQGNYADQMRTDEQMKILSHKPKKGEVVVVNALAGCGKTTTIALLCNNILTENPQSECLYLVYNHKAGEEAMQSNKFPKDGMEIRTTHSYVLRHLFGPRNGKEVNPKGEYNIDQIIKYLDLRRDVQLIFQQEFESHHVRGRKRLDRRVKVIAGYIRQTMKTFQASADKKLDVKHVSWRATKMTNLTEHTKWKERVDVQTYANWARQFFKRVQDECMNICDGGNHRSDIDITHDAYLKVAQLEKLRIPHQFVCIDEAQDMTECQADLFWGKHQRSGKIIYLFGDRYQQIYRFRGASHSFGDMVVASKSRFTLTGSFRFGKNIAETATCVLKALGGDTLHGRSNEDGKVIKIQGDDDDDDDDDDVDVDDDDDGKEEEEVESTMMERGVVLCRTRNGIYRYLHQNCPARWCYLSDGSKSNDPRPWQPKQLELDLESFIQGRTSSFTYKGEAYESIQDIEQYIEDEGDIDLGKALTLLRYLADKETSIQEFFSDLRDSYCPMDVNTSADEYDGVVMSTVHQAKGLEFDNVLIADDFRWKVIIAANMNRAIHCDEANILYVAITRSKCNLYLTQEASECLNFLSWRGPTIQLHRLPSLRSNEKKFENCNEIGFVWDPLEAAWQSNYNKLCSFHDEHGHTKIPCQDEEHKQLYSWCMRQRDSEAKGKSNDDRRDLLQKINFDFFRRKVRKGSSLLENMIIYELEEMGHVFDMTNEVFFESRYRPDGVIFVDDSSVIFVEVDERFHTCSSCYPIKKELDRMIALKKEAERNGYKHVTFVRIGTGNQRRPDFDQHTFVSNHLHELNRTAPWKTSSVRYIDYPTNHHHVLASKAEEGFVDEVYEFSSGISK